MEDKKELEAKIVDIIIGAVEQDALPSDEVPLISAYVLENIDAVSTHEKMINFLRNLSSKWPLFTNILVLKSGEVKMKTEEKVASNVLNLAKSGNIEEAIKLAKSATNAQDKST